MADRLQHVLPAEHRHGLWLPHSTTTLTLPMPSGERYAFQTWFNPVQRMIADNIVATGAPEPHWIAKQVPIEKALPL